METKNKVQVSASTIVRTVLLALALLNSLLAAFGKSPLPIDSEQLTQVLSTALTMAAALAAWWKNNSFTTPAILADNVKDALRVSGEKDVAVTIAPETDIRG
ncbi:MAG: phage holin [Ruthenibacterium sp.]